MITPATRIGSEQQAEGERGGGAHARQATRARSAPAELDRGCNDRWRVERHDRDLVTGGQTELLGRRALIERERQHAVRVEHQADRAAGQIGEVAASAALAAP